jgi:uncharacterized lipoprotein YajG
MKALLVIMASLLLLSGCAIPENKSYAAPGLDPKTLIIMAQDMADVITLNNPTKSTVFAIEPDPKTGFFRGLAEALRKKGYCVTDQPADNSTEIIYTIDWTSPDSLYTSATVGTTRYTKAYTFADGHIQSSSKEIIGALSHE